MRSVARIPLEEISSGSIAATVGNRLIGVFDVDGCVYAIENVCPHGQALLTDGHVDGAVVECALHNARFHIPSGQCLNGPGRDLATFVVRVTRRSIVISCERNY